MQGWRRGIVKVFGRAIPLIAWEQAGSYRTGMSQSVSHAAASSVLIRRAEPGDAAALSALKLACFRETFGAEGFAIPYPPADLARFEVDAYGQATVARELADPTHWSWVAQGDDGALLAYAHAGPCKLPHEDVREGDLELYQLYLRRSAQGAGLGKQLLDLALGWMEQQGPEALWLGVWQGNDRARHVYAGRGFAIAGEYRFAVGDWFDDEFIMRKPLSKA